MALIISPWNYPMQLVFRPLIAAIAAGCTAMVKPSELTGETAQLVAEIVSAAFNPDEVAVVQGGVETATHLLNLPFNHIYFTGSPAVGKIVMKAASQHPCSVTLELGGKSPVIVDDLKMQDVAKRWRGPSSRTRVKSASHPIMCWCPLTARRTLSLPSKRLYGGDVPG